MAGHGSSHAVGEERMLLFAPARSSCFPLAEMAQLHSRVKPSPREHRAGGKHQTVCLERQVIAQGTGSGNLKHPRATQRDALLLLLPPSCELSYKPPRCASVSFLQHRKYGCCLFPGTPLATSKGKSFCPQLSIIKLYQLRLLE